MLCLSPDFKGKEVIVLKTGGKTIILKFYRNTRGVKHIAIDAPPEVEISREKVKIQQ